MKDIVKFVVVGLTGYAIGFYEMKYKVLKCVVESNLKKEKDQKEES